MSSLNSAITQGGPGMIATLITVGLAIWAALASGMLALGRELAYRDQIIATQAKTIEEQRATNAALVQANQQQAATSQAALEMIRQELVPRLVGRGV